MDLGSTSDRARGRSRGGAPDVRPVASLPRVDARGRREDRSGPGSGEPPRHPIPRRYPISDTATTSRIRYRRDIGYPIPRRYPTLATRRGLAPDIRYPQSTVLPRYPIPYYRTLISTVLTLTSRRGSRRTALWATAEMRTGTKHQLTLEGRPTARCGLFCWTKNRSIPRDAQSALSVSGAMGKRMPALSRPRVPRPRGERRLALPPAANRGQRTGARAEGERRHLA